MKYIVLFLLTGCAPVLFADRAILWFDPDDKPIPLPKTLPTSVHWSAIRDIGFLPMDRAFGLLYGIEAENVNALDEVPNSSWFSDPRRDSANAPWRPRALDAEEIARGVLHRGDEPVPPIFVVKGKTIGATGGFVAEDSRGQRYLVKLDPPNRLGFATSTEIVVSRLAWACGYRVSPLSLVDVSVDEISVKPGAKTLDFWNQARPYSDDDLRLLLAYTPRNDRRVRFLASRWLKGTAVGTFTYAGRRGDDPNDRVPHENRRELRGFGVFSAWVNNIDTLQNNTLDIYEGEPGQGHVVHYQQDVGGAFGTWAFNPQKVWMGKEYYFNLWQVFGSLLSFGIPRRPWEGEQQLIEHEERLINWPEFGGFTWEGFNPKKWNPIIQNPAFDRQTARDRYWGAKRVVAISEPELRAAIDTGRYRSEAAEYLFNILWRRREAIARAYFVDVAALDYFRTDGEDLCFDDLWYQAGLTGDSRYGVRERRGHGKVSIRWSGAVGCVTLPPSGGYRVLELSVARGKHRSESVAVHMVERVGKRRIVGVER